MKKLAETIILFGTALGFAAQSPAQDAPAPEATAPEATEAAPAEAPAVPEVETPAAEQPATPPPAEPAVPAAADAATQPTESSAKEAAEYKAQILAIGQVNVAERWVQSAQDTLRDGKLNPAAFRLSANMMRAAVKLDKTNVRAWRLLAELELQAGNRDGAIAALKGYRTIASDDAIAQIQLIELYAGQFEAVDKELAYLRSLAGKETVPPEVRSHVHVMIARVQLERGEQAGALASLDAAIKLNPVNISALDLAYQLLPPDATLPQRAATLMAMVRANPIRPAQLAEMGRLLAKVGLGKDAADWMNRAFTIYSRTGRVDPEEYHDLAIDIAAQQFILGQYVPSRGNLEQIVKVRPNDIDAALLQLLLERGAKDRGPYDQARVSASAALTAHWAEVAKFVAGQPATTQPAAEGAAAAPATPATEPAEVAKQVQAAKDDAKQAAFVSAAIDYAWYEIYFGEEPGNAGKWINALETVLPEDNITLQRLRGWMQLATNQRDEARKTLTPIRDSDPLAALGLVNLDAPGGDPEAQKASDDTARKLLSENPSGLVGAILAQAFRDRQLKPVLHPDAEGVRAALKTLPRGWLDMAENPARFYTVRVDPVGVAYRFGEPIIVKVSFQNLTNQDLPIGDDGVIQPGLWFNAEIQADRSQVLNGVAFERIAYTSILPRGSGMSQYVRFDQGYLARSINMNPQPRLQIVGTCITNPAQMGNGYGPGPGGVRVQFGKKLTRIGFPLNKPEPLAKIYQEIELGLPDMKIRDVSLLSAYISQIRALLTPLPELPADADPQKVAARAQQEELRKAQAAKAEGLGGQMLDNIINATRDEVTIVAQWAKYEVARVATDEMRREMVDLLIADPTWEGRYLGVMAAGSLPRPVALELLQKVATSEKEEDLVKAYAAETLAVLSAPPATQPAAAEAAPTDVPAVPAVAEPAPAEPPAAETK